MNRTTRWKLLALLTAATALAGCRGFDAVVEIDEDGAGTRTVFFEPQFDESLTGEDLAGIFGLDPHGGWVEKRDEKGDIGYVRAAAASDAAAWTALGGDVRVCAYGDGDPSTGLSNEISLETGRTEEGRTYTYRERFEWRDLKQDLINLMSGVYERRVRALEPALSDGAVGELRGLFRAHMSRTWDDTGLAEDSDTFIAALTRAMAPDLEELVSRRALAVEVVTLQGLGASVIEDDDKQLEAVLERDMIGVGSAIFASFDLTVAMPGEIIDTNGELDEDGRATWRIGLLDPLDRPLEFHVRSLVRD